MFLKTLWKPCLNACLDSMYSASTTLSFLLVFNQLLCQVIILNVTCPLLQVLVALKSHDPFTLSTFPIRSRIPGSMEDEAECN